MSQQGVQLVIGRLVTDSVFRRRVERGGSRYLASLDIEGVPLARSEIALLIGMDPVVWTRAAELLDLDLRRRAAREAGKGRPASLTRHQQHVLRGVCDGLRNRDIARQLRLSESAVKAALQTLFRKFSVRRRTELVRLALGEPSWLGGSRRRDGAVVRVARRSGGADGDGAGVALVRANAADLAGGARPV